MVFTPDYAHPLFGVWCVLVPHRFAGHDTTAHTMTWFTYEMAKHPEYQVRLQREVDALFDLLDQEQRPMVYEDCVRLPFMTRCVMETLRLWTAVPNGTFRELQFDEEVAGPGGKPVTLPKGTYVQITNFARHRNPNLCQCFCSITGILPNPSFCSFDLNTNKQSAREKRILFQFNV